MLLSSINTDYRNDLHSWDEIESQVANIAKAGFTHVQWLHDWEGEYMYSPSEFFQVRDLLHHYGLGVNAIHASEGGRRTTRINGQRYFRNGGRFTEIRKDYTSFNEYNRLAGVDLLKNRVDLCSHIGAHYMVLHMQQPWQWFQENPQNIEDYYAQVYKSFDELQPYAKAAGVCVAIENLIGTPWKVQDEEFDRMFNRYDADFVGYTYDSGHASLQCTDDYYHFLRKYVDRLVVTHLQENAHIDEATSLDPVKVLAADVHWIPGDPQSHGNLDWDEISTWVAKSRVKMPADFEVGICGKDEEDEMRQLIICRKASEKFNQMVEEKRAKAAAK